MVKNEHQRQPEFTHGSQRLVTENTELTGYRRDQANEELISLQKQVKALQRTETRLRADLKAAVSSCDEQNKDFAIQYKKIAEELYRQKSSTAVLASRAQHLEQVQLDYQTQIEKMTQIMSRLSKRGLPYPPDDGHLKSELDGVVYEVRLFARSFTRGLKLLTLEKLSTIQMTEPVQYYLSQAFLDLSKLVSSQNVGARVRTRCVEVIMLGELLGRLRWGKHIGFPQGYYLQVDENFTRNMFCTAEEIQMWKALTAHLLTKNNKDFVQKQQEEIDQVTDTIYENIAQWGEFKRVNKQGLRTIVSKVADLGLELSQLPFTIQPLKLKLGMVFDENLMEDAEPENDEEEKVDHGPKVTTIILSPPWVKVTFKEDGTEFWNLQNPLCKAQVSCLV